MSGRTFEDERDFDLDKSKSKKSKTPLLDNFGRDLTALARADKLDPVIGRDKEVAKTIQILSKRKKNNAILVGEPGVGKTAIAEGFALKIVAKDIDASFHDKRIIELNMMSIVSGTKYRGQFEERMEDIMKEVAENPEIILFVDEFHNVVGAGNSAGSLDASNIIKPALARGDLRMIASTTTEEYKKIIEKDGALERRFQKVNVDVPSREETLEILHQIKDKYENHHKVSYSDEVLTSCVDLADRYMTYRNNPDKAIDLMDEVGAKVKLASTPETPENILELEEEVDGLKRAKDFAVKTQEYEKAANLSDKEKLGRVKLNEAKAVWQETLKAKGNTIITLEDVAIILSAHTGIPVNKLTNSEHQKLLTMGADLKGKLIGQSQAVEKVTQAIQRSRVGIQDPNRPISSFLFLGSTGVGKTELTKLLAKYLFHDEKAMIRIDMSEYMERHTVSKLIGSPPGYVGHDDGGQLTEKVKSKPHSVVLFDEIEKAHPDVMNIMLQILDDGKLTDSFGREIDFKNTIIIMTSNIGTSKIIDEKQLGFNTGSASVFPIEELVLEELKKKFRPEFINRIDDVIVFNQLTKDDVRAIVDIQLNILTARVKKIDAYELRITDEVKDFLAEVGYDKNYGARPLKRAIINNIQNTITSAILEERITPGDVVELTLNKEEKKVIVNKANG